MDFRGKTVLVTGGTSGIGACTALEFAGAGAAVAITGRDSARGAEVTAAAGADAHFIEADLRQPGVAARIIADVVDRYGGLDVLVSNAGINHRFGTLETSDEHWLETMTVNVSATFFLGRESARVMKDRGGGTIVNMSSDIGLIADPGKVSYCMSKGAIVQLTRAMALDLAPHNIRVNAVAPADTRTPLIDSKITARGLSVERGYELIGLRVPMKRVARPEEVARVILFLASDDASYITGVTVPIDGGATSTGPPDIDLGTGADKNG